MHLTAGDQQKCSKMQTVEDTGHHTKSSLGTF